MEKAKPTPPIGSIPDGIQKPQLARARKEADWSNPHPLYCVWEITLKCDLGCKHCGSRAGKSRVEELSTEGCLDVVRQLDELGVREVTLIGGEAYLRDDWDIIAKEITARGMVCGITTGARNLTEERTQRAVDAGVKTISISIDGLERTHDIQRGAKGSFRSAMDAAIRVAKTPMRLATNTQINRLSFPELGALAKMLVEIGSKAWQIQLTVPMGRAADRPALLLQPYELLTLYPLLVYLKSEVLEPGGVTLFPGNNIGYFGPYEGALRYGGDKGAHWGGCPAGAWSIGLEADGKIKACPSLPSEGYTGGNLKDTELAYAIEHAAQINFIKQRTKADLWGFCGDCYYADICKAGCTWTSQVFLGKPGNNPYCIHRAMERERAGLKERFERVEAAPGLPFDQGRFELFLEPADASEAEPPSICGHSLERVTSLPADSDGLWSDEALREMISPGPKSNPVLKILH